MTVAANAYGLTPRERRWGIALRVLSLVVLLLLWEWWGRDPTNFATPPPSRVFPELIDGITSGRLPLATLTTLSSVAVGMLLSIVIGLVIGFAIPLFKWAKNTIDPLVDAVYAMPVTMLIPIVGVYTGLGFRGRVFIVVTYVAMVIVMGTATGVREVDKGVIEAARSLGASGFRLWRSVVFPAALPHIGSAVTIGVARGVRGAVTAELLLIAAGLGAIILRAGSSFDTVGLMAAILWTLLLGYVLYALAAAAERRMLSWRGD